MDIFNYLEENIPKNIPIAHVWYEESLNFGDSAIWYAQCKILKDLELNIVYECSDKNYNESIMEEKIGSNGIILLRGGGNFNDIYSYHLLRLKIIDKFTNNKIIQLPQSIYFKNLNDIIFIKTKEIIEKHKNLVIMARDKFSYDFAKNNFQNVNVLMFPDISTYLSLESFIENYIPITDILWLMRYDSETKLCEINGNQILYPSIYLQKYLNDNTKSVIYNFYYNNYIISCNMITSNNMEITDWYLCCVKNIKYNTLTYFQKAELGLMCSIFILQRAKIIITDRLHSFLIASFLHIPVILIDTNNDKLTNYVKTWKKECIIVNSVDDAYEIANKYLKNTEIHQFSTYTKKNRYLEFFNNISYVIEKENLNILSFGCSTGEECTTLNNIFKNCKIFGTDIRNDLEEICKNKNVNFIKYENLSNYKFDVIFCMSVLCKNPELLNAENSLTYPLNEFENLLTFIHSLLKISGKLILYNTNYRFSDSNIYKKYKVILINSGIDELPKFNKSGEKINNNYNEFVFEKIYE